METMSAIEDARTDGWVLPVTVWSLYLLALVTALPFVAGLIVAYAARSGSAPVWYGHYTVQIRTFWWALLWFVVGFVLHFVLIGYVVWAVLWLWMFVRCMSGLLRALDGRPAPGF